MTKEQLTELISTMTLEEKAAQMTQLNPVNLGFECITPLTGPDCGLRVSPETAASIGSILNCDNAGDMIQIQKKHLESDPHRIPLLFMADVIHGFKTIFPIPLAMGCSFSKENVREAAEIAAEECAVSGIHVTFSPMADLVRDPRWGRVMESFGEDPMLNSALAAASVEGYQGDDVSAPRRMASCVKHFAAYGAPEGGREYNTVDLSDSVLRNTYLPGYHAALQAGAKMIMSSFNPVDLIPATANRGLLTDILRQEWGFPGIVISDYNTVGELLCHGVASDGAEAARKSLNAGLDMEMMSTHYIDSLKQLSEDGRIAERTIDEAVLRILELKNQLGLFDNPYKDADPSAEQLCHLSRKNRQAARRIAGESAVLLKNEKVLPLSPPSHGRKIGLTGPFANSPYVLGGWSAGQKEGVSLYDGLCTKISPDSLRWEDCGDLTSSFRGRADIPCPQEDFFDRFSDCEIVVVAVGEHQDDTGEGASRAYLRLSPNQELLIRRLKEAGKKVAAVVFSGRPLEISPVEPCCDAILQAWFLGTESGNALADLLSGDRNPSGRLCMSFPYTVGQIPVYYNHFQTGRPQTADSRSSRYVSRYLDCPTEPLYCFGYGLSYSDFHYSSLTLHTEGTLRVSVTVANCSAVPGAETVQLYIRDLTASQIRPVSELKDFARVCLAGGESRTVTFAVTKDMLSFYSGSEKVFEPGNFCIMIGKNSEETLQETIYIDETLL